MRASNRRNYATSIVAALVLAFALVPGAHAYPRPKSATAINVALVPAFQPCTSPNRLHGPPLEKGSCSPPVQASNFVTVGTPENNSAADNSVGSFQMRVQRGIPGAPEDSDILFTGSVSDVRCIGSTTACGSTNAADGPDYTGRLQGNMTVRITDRWNATGFGGGTDPATSVDVPFPVAFGCADTVDVDMGGLCTANTSVNAVVPASPPTIRDGKRSVWAVGQVFVTDGGQDGATDTSPNTTFLRQGVFVP